VLITGSGGLVGRSLVPLLRKNGFEVVRLVRNNNLPSGSGVYTWNLKKQYVDPAAFRGVTHIVHLAGSNIAAGRWTEKRKREIVKSRVDSARLLYDTAARENIPLRCFVSASGTGYYGIETGERIFLEEDPPGNDFLARTCVKWEESAGLFRKSGIRSVILRTAVVIAGSGGFLKRVIPLLKVRTVLWFGNGQQHFPWIHIDDLCNIYLKALVDDKMEGPYNAVAPGSVTQREFMRCMARIKGIPAFRAGIPSYLVKLAFGEMSSLLLTGSRVSSAAIEAAGYSFSYPSCEDAMEQVLSSQR
jgi:uncharacterized protein (TIGR01777 family)